MKKLLYGAAFVVAISGAFIAKAASLDKSGYVGDSPTNCTLQNIPDNCSPTNQGALCTDQHLVSDCSDQLFQP